MSDLAWLKRLTDHRLLTAREEAELGRRIQAGDPEAKRRLIEHNGRLAVSMAREFVGKGVEFEDLVQAALTGVCMAAEKFDPAREVKFSTYATWWIRQQLQRCVHGERAEAIHLPSGIRNLRGRALALLGDEPRLTDDEIAARLDTTADRVRTALDAATVADSLDREVPGADGGEAVSVGGRVSSGEDVEADVLDAVETEEADGVWALLDRLDEVDALAAYGMHGQGRSASDVGRELGMRHKDAEAAADRGLERLRELAIQAA